MPFFFLACWEIWGGFTPPPSPCPSWPPRPAENQVWGWGRETLVKPHLCPERGAAILGDMERARSCSSAHLGAPTAQCAVALEAGFPGRAKAVTTTGNTPSPSQRCGAGGTQGPGSPPRWVGQGTGEPPRTQKQPQNGSLESERHQAERPLPPQQAHSLQSGSWLLSNQLPLATSPTPSHSPSPAGAPLSCLYFLKGPAVPGHLQGSDSPLASEGPCGAREAVSSGL